MKKKLNLKLFLKTKIKDERGISVIETLFVLALSASILAFSATAIRQFMGSPTDEGFAAKVIGRQTKLVDSSTGGDRVLVISEGCVASTSNCSYVHTTND